MSEHCVLLRSLADTPGSCDLQAPDLRFWIEDIEQQHLINGQEEVTLVMPAGLRRSAAPKRPPAQ